MIKEASPTAALCVNRASSFAAAVTLLFAVAGPASAASAVLGKQADAHRSTQKMTPSAIRADDPTSAVGNQTTKQLPQLKEVFVTGSRIGESKLAVSAGLQVVSHTEFQLQGTQNVENLLNQLPSVQGNFSTNQTSNPGGARGVANVDLRGLGPSRTLVLIDGKRVMPGSPLGGPEVDLNFIPQALVERVAVLTGGASSVYGSDAVAGVVNFIMKKDFSGFTVDNQESITGRGDGFSYDTTLIWGNNFADGTGNVTVYAGYTKLNAVTDGQRPFGVYALATLPDGSLATSNQQCQQSYGPASQLAYGRCTAGSSAIPGGRFISNDRAGAGLSASGIVDPNGSANIIPDNGAHYNFNPFNYLRLPESRYNLGGFAHRKFNAHFDLYGNVMFMENSNTTQAAPDAIINTFNINCNNPLLSAQEEQWLCGDAGLTPTDTASVIFFKRTAEFGNREDNIRHTDYRIVVGSQGTIVPGISYDLSAQRGESILNENFTGAISQANLQQALLATTGPNGSIVCENQSGGCVPANIFTVGGLNNPATQAYLAISSQEQGTTIQTVDSGSITGDLTQYGVISPLAKQGIGFAIGAAHRRNRLDFLPGYALTSGALGSPVLPVSGSVNVNSYFGELNVPLIEDRPYATLLSVDTGYRLSRYDIASRSGNVLAHTYKFGLHYAPVSDVAFHVSYNRAIRAPDINELFAPTTHGSSSGSDPCAGAVNPATGTVGSGATLAQCERTGVTAAQYGTIPQCVSGLCSGLFGGNLNLQPEIGITREFGMVVRPRFAPGLKASVNYYDINLTNEIGTLNFNTILNECISRGLFCNDVHRGQGGELFGSTSAFVSETNVNVGYVRERGLDVSLADGFDLRRLGLGDSGTVYLNFSGTYLLSFDEESSPGLPVFQCAGLYGFTCGFPRPSWRHNMRVTWEVPSDWPVKGLGVSLLWRYISPVNLDQNQKGTPLAGAPDPTDGVLGRRQYLDLTLTYNRPHLTVHFGVTNLTGRDPPLTSTVGNFGFANPQFFGDANTFPVLYDSLGRVLFVGFTAHFK